VALRRRPEGENERTSRFKGAGECPDGLTKRHAHSLAAAAPPQKGGFSEARLEGRVVEGRVSRTQKGFLSDRRASWVGGGQGKCYSSCFKALAC
jgi:hypothetical protein